MKGTVIQYLQARPGGGHLWSPSVAQWSHPAIARVLTEPNKRKIVPPNVLFAFAFFCLVFPPSPRHLPFSGQAHIFMWLFSQSVFLPYRNWFCRWASKLSTLEEGKPAVLHFYSSFQIASFCHSQITLPAYLTLLSLNAEFLGIFPTQVLS